MFETHVDPARAARFSALFEAHQRQVLAYAARRSASLADAEDVVAETFAIAWRKIDAIPSEGLPWLYAVARRVLANQRRGNSRRARLTTALGSVDVATPVHVGEDSDGPAQRVLATLPPGDQEVLRLVAWEGLGNNEIAVVLGISPNAVAIRLHRARGRFTTALADVTRSALKDPGRSRTSAEVKGTNSALRGASE